VTVDTLTDEECDDVVIENGGGDTLTERRRAAVRAAFALGCARQRKRDAEYIRRTFARCALMTANGYLNGDDVAARIEEGQLTTVTCGEETVRR
jgi:hypothetical protein